MCKKKLNNNNHSKICMQMSIIYEQNSFMIEMRDECIRYLNKY